MFQPSLFIGIGEKSCYFTLRERYLHEQWIGGRCEKEIRSFHHFNLSQDPDEAIAKATEAAERLGLPLNTTRAEITEQLNAIKRATADELKERQEREIRWEAERAEREAKWMEEQKALIVDGRFPTCFRNHGGEPFIAAGIGYLNWVMDKADEFKPGSLLAMVANKVLELHADLRLPCPDKTKVIGEPGKRQTFEVTVIRTFDFTGIYGTTYFVTMVTPDGCCLLSKGRFNAEVGEKLTIKATVKEHDEYKGQAQTVVQRVAVIN